MAFDLSGRVAIVSAGSRGIGRACALALASAGADVAICGRNTGDLDKVKAQIASLTNRTPFTAVADLADSEAIGAFVVESEKRLGSADILVANSIGPKPGLFDEFDDRAWLEAFEGALLSTVRLIRAVLPGMKRSGRGAVVGIQSTSVKQPIPYHALSNGIRPGVAGLFKSLAAQYGPDGIRFNLVLPGRINTERFVAVERSHGGNVEERVAKLAAELPLRRLGTPEEVADGVLFLASDRASFITGAVLQIDGGNMRGLF